MGMAWPLPSTRKDSHGDCVACGGRFARHRHASHCLRDALHCLALLLGGLAKKNVGKFCKKAARFLFTKFVSPDRWNHFFCSLAPAMLFLIHHGEKRAKTGVWAEPFFDWRRNAPELLGLR